MAVITMSEKEPGRLRVLVDVIEGKLAIVAAKLLVSPRRCQILGLLERLRATDRAVWPPGSTAGAAKA